MNNTKEQYTTEEKVEVAKIIFTETNITPKELAANAGIHLRTVSYWRDKVLNGVPDYLLKTFGDADTISLEDRAEATVMFLRYDCDSDDVMMELKERYGATPEQIREWSGSVLENLGEFFVSKRGSSSRPIKSKLPPRKPINKASTADGMSITERLAAGSEGSVNV